MSIHTLEELPKPDELTRLPSHVVSLSTLWPQLVNGLFVLASVIYWILDGGPQAASAILLTSAIFTLTMAYLYAMVTQQKQLLLVLPWVGGYSLAFLFVLVSIDLLSAAVICIVAAASYGLAASGRKLMRLGLMGSVVAMALVFGLAELIRSGVINTGLSLTPLVTRWVSGIFLLGMLVDLMQRLWRHYDRTDAAFTRLQVTNIKLNQTKSDLNRKIEQHAKLLEVSRVVGSTLELSDLLRVILEQLQEVVEYGGASIMMLKGNGVSVLSTTGHLTKYAELMESSLDSTPHRMKVVQTAKPLVVSDLQGGGFFPSNGSGPRRMDAVLADIGTWMGVPLIVRGNVIGLLAMTHPISGYFSNDHAELTMAFANQVAVAIEGARARDEAIRSAALAERNRLARELHDSVSQNLFGITLGLRTALGNPKQAEHAVKYSLDLSEIALAEMRALIFELRPESLREDGLLVAFRKQAAALMARNKIELKLMLDELEPPISMAAKEALYRIGLEALQNAIRHAVAQSIELKVSCTDHQVTVEIIDNGKGFDVQGSFPGHLGLRSMRERAEQCGGTLVIASELDKGTQVRVTLPT